MAVLAVSFAAGVVLFRTPIASVISLLGSFFCLATIYLVSGFPLLAAVQILVYAGAILVLFLFVIMLLNLADVNELPEIDRSLFEKRHIGIAAAISLVLLGVGLFAINTSELQAADPALAGQAIDSITGEGGLAQAMFTSYLLPFEATSLLLLATAVAVLVLAKRQRPGPQDAGQAVALASAPAPGDSRGGSTAHDPSAASPQHAADGATPERELVTTGGPE